MLTLLVVCLGIFSAYMLYDIKRVIDGGETKSGIAPADVLALAAEVAKLPCLALRGLMTIPDPVDGFDAQVAVHAKARAMFNEVKAALNLPQFDYNFALRGHMAGAHGPYQAAHSIRMKNHGWERRVKHGRKLELTQNTYSSKCSSQMITAIGATTL